MLLMKKNASGYEKVKNLQRGLIGSRQIIEIKASDARKLLEESSNCRETSKAKVREITGYIVEYGYNPHVSDVSYSAEGREDGTHRLSAIVEAAAVLGEDFKHKVQFKVVPPKVGLLPCYDSGNARSYKDIAAVHGVHVSSKTWTIVNTFCRLVNKENVDKHDKRERYLSHCDLYDRATELFRSGHKGGFQNVFAVCWIISQLEVDCVSEKTRKSLEDFTLWLQENFKVMKDSKGGAVCCKIVEDFKNLEGSSEQKKTEVLHTVLRYSIGRKWEVQKDRSGVTKDTNTVASDKEKVRKWLGGVR